MALKKVRFVWSTPALSGGRWRFGLFNLQPVSGPAPRAFPGGALPAYWKNYLHHALHLSVRGLFIWGAFAALAGYLGAAALLLRRLEASNPRNRVAYADLVNPARWSRLDRLRGEGFVLQGRDLLHHGDFPRGFALLRVGLEKNPADHEARLEIARLYAGLRLRAQAEQLLRDGLSYGYPGRAYLEFAFGLAADADRPADWASLAEAARARFDVLPAALRGEAEALWLDRQRVRALRADGRDAEAVALVEAAYPAGHPFRRETVILRLLADGRPGDAVHLAERWSRDEPRAPEPLRLLARACREAGSFGEMDAALGRLRALDPVKPEPLLYALAQNRLAGRDEAARAALDEIILRHGAGAAVYSAAAAVLVEVGDAAGIDRLEAELRDRGLPLRSVLQARLQLAVSRRDWPDVLRRVADLRAASGSAPADARTAWLETAARLARACLDGASGTQTSLVEIVSDHPGTFRLYTLILGSLLDAGRAATARQILTLAEGPYQNARAIVALRARVEAALAAAEPPPAAPVAVGVAPDRLASFDVFSGVFASCIENRDTDSALELLAAARRVRPGWFSAAELRLDAMELPLRARGDDPLRLQLLARGALARGTEAADRLLALALEIDAESPALRSNARLLLKEILRRDPAHAAAFARLAAWEPRADGPPLDSAP